MKKIYIISLLLAVLVSAAMADEVTDALRIKADQGDGQAQMNLGIRYVGGNGVSKDLAEAARWLRKAADKNIPQAQFRLGVMYANGLGVEKDEKEAWWLYYNAAMNGDTDAPFHLGLLHANGAGTDRDLKNLVQAHAWLSISILEGNEKAKKVRDEVETYMTKGQIEKAKSVMKETVVAIEGQLSRNAKKADVQR